MSQVFGKMGISGTPLGGREVATSSATLYRIKQWHFAAISRRVRLTLSRLVSPLTQQLRKGSRQS